jgi:hypothetical protein
MPPTSRQMSTVQELERIEIMERRRGKGAHVNERGCMRGKITRYDGCLQLPVANPARSTPLGDR